MHFLLAWILLIGHDDKAYGSRCLTQELMQREQTKNIRGIHKHNNQQVVFSFLACMRACRLACICDSKRRMLAAVIEKAECVSTLPSRGDCPQAAFTCGALFSMETVLYMAGRPTAGG